MMLAGDYTAGSFARLRMTVRRFFDGRTDEGSGFSISLKRAWSKYTFHFFVTDISTALLSTVPARLRTSTR